MPFKLAVDLVQRDAGSLFDVVEALELAVQGTRAISEQWPETSHLLQDSLQYREQMLNQCQLLTLVKVLRPSASISDPQFAEPVPRNAIQQMKSFVEPRYRLFVEKGWFLVFSFVTLLQGG